MTKRDPGSHEPSFWGYARSFLHVHMAREGRCPPRRSRPTGYRSSALSATWRARTVPLMDKTASHMETYLDEFHPGWRRSRPGDPLFYCRRRGIPVRLSTDAISSVLKKAADIARESCPEVPEKMYPHLVRKTRAVGLYRQGIPLPIIAQLLGHESISTTSGFYAFAGEEMVFEAMAQIASPVMVDSPAKWKDERVIEALYSLR